MVVCQATSEVGNLASRYNLDVGHTLQAIPELSMTLQYTFIDELANNTSATYEPEGKVDSFGIVNLRSIYEVPGVDGLKVSLMLRNLTKEDPPLNTAGNYNRQLHDNGGMSTIVGFSWDL